MEDRLYTRALLTTIFWKTRGKIDCLCLWCSAMTVSRNERAHERKGKINWKAIFAKTFFPHISHFHFSFFSTPVSPQRKKSDHLFCTMHLLIFAVRYKPPLANLLLDSSNFYSFLSINGQSEGETEWVIASRELDWQTERRTFQDYRLLSFSYFDLKLNLKLALFSYW